MNKLLASFKYAIQGIKYGFASQRNLKIHGFTAVAVIALGNWLRLVGYQWVIIYICIGMVIAAELLNSALEKTLDLLHPEKNDHVKNAKDMAAGAVLICSLVAVIVAGYILLPRLLDKLN